MHRLLLLTADFDTSGGYTSDMEARLQALLQSAQPDAVAFGGEGISSNPARWCGTEDGDPPGWPTSELYRTLLQHTHTSPFRP
jgi:hypothetical protein